jgi:hypothetical protein
MDAVFLVATVSVTAHAPLLRRVDRVGLRLRRPVRVHAEVEAVEVHGVSLLRRVDDPPPHGVA